ncbi:MAG TPA: SMI1/KNR4 family protein [Planctomycetota bacterium]|nr:SMI1/KNR4 family protein [Planctomycetota bacterium]
MQLNELERVASSLGVGLPEAYKNAMQRFPFLDDLGSTEWSLWDDADAIIARTLEYRRGDASAPPWDHRWVYLGDDDDACPYALDTVDGHIVKTDHGDTGGEPLGTWANMDDLVSHLADDYEGRTVARGCSAEEYSQAVAAHVRSQPRPPKALGVFLRILIVVLLSALAGYLAFRIFLAP